uniref:Uncharacterized protein n=1 Tax=viral metagenome TaxID=1070528 RepID=A0A6M3JP12_9ZZZZ
MKTRTGRREIVAQAREAGLLCRTWSPGDGVTRYRFFALRGVAANQT